MRAGLDYTHIPVNYGTLLHDRYLCFKILYFLSFIRLCQGHMAKEPKYSPQEDDPEMYRHAQ